jgi:hypothetical protein
MGSDSQDSLLQESRGIDRPRTPVPPSAAPDDGDQSPMLLAVLWQALKDARLAQFALKRGVAAGAGSVHSKGGGTLHRPSSPQAAAARGLAR